MRKSLRSVTKIFEMVLIHNRGLKPTNKYIILHFSILLFMTLCPLFLAQCAVLTYSTLGDPHSHCKQCFPGLGGPRGKHRVYPVRQDWL